MTKAKLFITGGSQAVRLPAEFRFEGDEVDIRRDSTTGDVVLSKPIASWEEYFDWVRTLELPRDFLEERNQPEGPAATAQAWLNSCSTLKSRRA